MNNSKHYYVSRDTQFHYQYVDRIPLNLIENPSFTSFLFDIKNLAQSTKTPHLPLSLHHLCIDLSTTRLHLFYDCIRSFYSLTRRAASINRGGDSWFIEIAYIRARSCLRSNEKDDYARSHAGILKILLLFRDDA